MTRISSGVMSEPPPMPVSPIRMPTPKPKRMTSGSIVLDVQPALRLVGPRPAARAAVARLRARRAADRGVAAVVQRVVRQGALVGPPPQVLLGPVDERVVLPHRALLVPLDRLGVRAGRRLLAADARDPGVRAGECGLERGPLGRAAALLRAGPRAGRVGDLDPHAEALLERAPGLQR